MDGERVRERERGTETGTGDGDGDVDVNEGRATGAKGVRWARQHPHSRSSPHRDEPGRGGGRAEADYLWLKATGQRSLG